MVICAASKPNFLYSARMPRFLACTLPVSWPIPASSAARRTAASSSSPTPLRSGIAATASDLKFPYLAPVRELVLADSQAQPTGRPGASSATATSVISPCFPSAPATRLRCSPGSVMASSPNDTFAISTSNPAIASRSSSRAGRIR